MKSIAFVIIISLLGSNAYSDLRGNPETELNIGASSVVCNVGDILVEPLTNEHYEKILPSPSDITNNVLAAKPSLTNSEASLLQQIILSNRLSAFEKNKALELIIKGLPTD